MQIKITRGFCLRPGVDVKPGDVVEASKLEAIAALNSGRAVPFDDVAAEPAVREQAQPALVSKIIRRAGGRK